MSSFWATGLLLSVFIFCTLPPVDAQSTSTPAPQTVLIAIERLNSMLEQLASVVQNTTARLEELSTVLKQLQQQQLAQQSQNGSHPATSSSATVAEAASSFSGEYQLPECSGTTNSSSSSSSSTPEDKAELSTRRQFILNMTLSAWNAYKQYAWGNATLRPLSLKPRGDGEYQLGNLDKDSGESIIAAFSTLLVMNLTEQSTEAVHWALTRLNFSAHYLDGALLFEKLIAGQLGGLLSASELLRSGGGGIYLPDLKIDWAEALLTKAKHFAAVLKAKVFPDYNATTTHITTASLPANLFNPKRAQERTTLSQAGGNYLEFAHLTNRLGDESYRRVVDRLRERVTDSKYNGLYDNLASNAWRSGAPTRRVTSLGTQGRDFYYNLLRSYLQSGGKLKEALQLYNETVFTLVAYTGMFTAAGSGNSPVAWVRDVIRGDEKRDYGDTMSYSTCYLGAMFSLGTATTFPGEKSCDQLARVLRQFAVELTRTCRLAANGTATKMGPSQWKVNAQGAVVDESGKRSYYLSPELAESYFILWRTTKDPQYREAAWEMAQALKRYSQRENGGFAGFEDVTSVDKLKDDQPALFLSATLKYLYLTFTDDDVLPLSKWIFNSAGHPLPICGQHAHLPLEKCKYPISV